jgi:hypothetical protein
MSSSNRRLLLAVAVGILLGLATAEVADEIARGRGSNGPVALFVFLVGCVVNPIIVCLVTRSWYILVGMIPTVAATGWLLFEAFFRAYRNRGTNLMATVQMVSDPRTIGLCTGFLLVSLAVSVLMHRIRTAKAADVHDTPEKS